MKYTVLIYLLFLLIFTSCRKDEDFFVVEETTLSPLKVGVVGGLISDVNGNVLSNTTVNLKTKDNNYQTDTDASGVFYFSNSDLPEERCYISVEATGFFPGSRTFVPKKGVAEFIHINLIPLDGAYSFEAVNGADIDLADGAQIAIAPDAFNNQNGNTYNGTVYLANSFLNSNDPKMNLLMPGDLSARNAEGLWQSLATYGIMALRATDDAGALLQIASPDKVSIHLPITDEQLSTAPSTIHLWTFDVENGYWSPAGTAQKQGDYYESNLTDFTFLNWAVPYPMISLTTNLQLFGSAISYPNALVEVAVVGSGVCSYGLTDNEGNLETSIAANQVLSLRVRNHCGEWIYEGEIGPYGTDTKTGAVSLAAGNNTGLVCKGKLIDCEGIGIVQGYVTIDLGNDKHILFTDTNGNFEAYLDTCDADQLLISGTDVLNGKESDILDFLIGDAIDTGSISVCD